MAPTPTDAELKRARAKITELERDVKRVDELAIAAEREADALVLDPGALPDAAARAAGLRGVHQRMLADLHAARAEAERLQAQADEEHAHQHHRESQQRVERASISARQAADDAVDALLPRLTTYREALAELHAAHQQAAHAAVVVGVEHRPPADRHRLAHRYVREALGRLPGAEALARLATSTTEPGNRATASERRQVERERLDALPEKRRQSRIAGLRRLLADAIARTQAPGDMALDERERARAVIAALAALGEPVDPATLPWQLRELAA